MSYYNVDSEWITVESKKNRKAKRASSRVNDNESRNGHGIGDYRNGRESFDKDR